MGHVDNLATISNTAGTTAGLIPLSSNGFQMIELSSQKEDVHAVMENAYTGLDDGISQLNLTNNDNYLYDTAGVIHKNQLTPLFTLKELNYIHPSHRLKNRIIKRHGSQTLFLGGFVRIDVLDSKSICLFHVYCSNKLSIHKSELERVPELMTMIGSDSMYPPIFAALSKKERKEQREMKKTKLAYGQEIINVKPSHQTKTPNSRHVEYPDLKLAKSVKNDYPFQWTIFISGVGWIMVDGSCEFSIYTPGGMGIYMSNHRLLD